MQLVSRCRLKSMAAGRGEFVTSETRPRNDGNMTPNSTPTLLDAIATIFELNVCICRAGGW